MEEERVFMNAMNTILEMLSLTFRRRCQRDGWLNVSENDLVQKVKHEFNSMKDTLTMDAPHKESIMGNYSAFSREWVAYYSSFGDIMKAMMNWKEEKKRKGRRERGGENKGGVWTGMNGENINTGNLGQDS